LSLPLVATRIPRRSLVSSKSPGVAGTKALALSDLWLERRILRFRSLFPFPLLQRPRREQRPPQGEWKFLAAWWSAPRYQVASTQSSTRMQMTKFEAVGVLEKAPHPPSKKSAARLTIPAQGYSGKCKDEVRGESAMRNLFRNRVRGCDRSKPALDLDDQRVPAQPVDQRLLEVYSQEFEIRTFSWTLI